VPRDESQVSVGGLLALGYGRKRRLRHKRKNANCAEDTMNVTRSKQEKEQKRWSKVKGRNLLDEDIEDGRSARKTDHGKLNKWKNPLLDAMEHHAGRKERQAVEALKIQIKLT
jgi:hypothetical protein